MECVHLATPHYAMLEDVREGPEHGKESEVKGGKSENEEEERGTGKERRRTLEERG